MNRRLFMKALAGLGSLALWPVSACRKAARAAPLPPPLLPEPLPLPAPPRNVFYVSTICRPDGAGTAEDPWDLATAMQGGPTQKEVQPGSTIFLRGGTYKGNLCPVFP